MSSNASESRRKPGGANAPSEPVCNGKKLSQWLRRLDTAATDADQKMAADAIRSIGKPAIPFLLVALRQGGRHAQRAYNAFSVLGAEAVSAVDEIRRDPGPTPYFAGAALGAIGGPALEALETFLTHPDAMVRNAGAVGLSEGLSCEKFQPSDVRSFLPQLLKNLGDEHSSVRASTASLIGAIGADPSICVPALADLLHDHAHVVIATAAQALCRFGPAAAGALAPLLELQRTADAVIRQEILKAIARTAQPELYEVIKAALTDDAFGVRLAALDGLGYFPKHVSEVVPILIEVLERSDQAEMKWNALWALGRLGPLARAALPTVRKLLDNPNQAGGEETVRNTIGRIERSA